jgi:hypothetical protein
MQVLERLISAVTEQLQLLSSQTRETATAAALPGGAERFFWETNGADRNGRREK